MSEQPPTPSRFALRGRQLREAEQRLHPDFRRSLLTGGAAVACLVVGHRLGGLARPDHRYTVYGCGLGLAVLGVVAARAAASEVSRVTALRAGTSTATSLRVIVLLVGYLVVTLAVLDLLALPVHYFVGGTVIAVVLGVAAQQVLGNLFAGLVLLFARPYVPGQYVRIRSGALGGPHDGVVSTVGLLYTAFESSDGLMNIPNSALLAAAVGPVPPPAPQDPDPDGSDPDGSDPDGPDADGPAG